MSVKKKSERFKRSARKFSADHLLVTNKGETLAFTASEEGEPEQSAYLNVDDVRRLVEYLQKLLP